MNVMFLKLSRIFVELKFCFKLYFKRMHNFLPCKRPNVVNVSLTAVVKLKAPFTFFFINRLSLALSFNLSNLLAILDPSEMRRKNWQSSQSVVKAFLNNCSLAFVGSLTFKS